MKKTNVPGSQSFGQKLLQFIRNNTVPIIFNIYSKAEWD